MRKVLIVSYFYPPCHRVGGVRPSKFSRYLPEFGWQPRILTVRPDGLPAEFTMEVPEAWVTRTMALDVNFIPRLVIGRERVAHQGFHSLGARRFGGLLEVLGSWYRDIVDFPDPEIGWFPFAIAAGRRIIQQERPAVIVSSSVPFTSHLVAARLAARAGLPWVADFRDLWTDAHNWRRRDPIRSLEIRLERLVMRRAAAVVTVSKPWAERLRRYGRPVYAIPNGYDEADYPDEPAATQLPDRSRFTLAYTGTLTPGKQDPALLMEAVAALRRKEVVTPENFQVTMVGWYLDHARRAAEQWGVTDLVRVSPALAQDEANRLCRNSSALLFFSWSRGRGDVEHGWYSAKVFGYLACGRRILAVGPGMDMGSRLIERSRAGVVARTAEEVESVLRSWIEEYRCTGALSVAIDQSQVTPFSRRAQAGRLAQVLDRVTATAAERITEEVGITD